jgi:hypothetical protein
MAMTDTVDMAARKANKGWPLLSVQEVTDCSVSYGNKGCGGGWFSKTSKYLRERGVHSADYYPELSAQSGQHGNCWTFPGYLPIYKVNTWV